MKPFESSIKKELEDYLAHRRELGHADQPFRSFLRLFDRYVEENCAGWSSFNPGFFLEMRTRLAMAPRTVNGIISATRGFFHYLERREKWEDNPLKHIPPLTETAYIPYIFSPEQTEQLLTALQEKLWQKKETAIKDFGVYLAITLLVRCGLRISEPLRLQVNHYRPKEKSIYIEKTKFKKDRLIPIQKAVADQIDNYLALREAFSTLGSGAGQSPYLLADDNGNQLKRTQIYPAFNKAVKEIGLAGKKQLIANTVFGSPTPHSLRHSFAVNTLARATENGHSPEKILPILAAYLGHSHYKYTVVYLKALNAKRRQGLLTFSSKMTAKHEREELK